MDLVVLTVRTGLAAVLLVAGVTKALDLGGSRRAVAGFGVPRRVADVLGTALPPAEVLVAVALVIDGSARLGGLAALVLFVGFTGGVGRAVLRGEAPECHCFGQLHSEPAGPATLVRNAVLAAGALLVVVAGPGGALNDLDGSEAGALVGFVLAGALGLTSSSLWTENRRLRRRADGADAPDFGLEPGTPAPQVSLRSIAHEGVVPLRSTFRPGTPTVIVQVSPFCGPCAKLMPELAQWENALGGRLTIVTVSAGDADTNREFARASGLSDLLYTTDLDIGTAFRALVTPSAIPIGADGRVASRPVAGADAIESLIRVELRRADTDRPVSLVEASAAPLEVRHSGPQ